MLLDPHSDWSVANRVDDVLGVLPAQVATHASAETHACVVELSTAPFATVAAASAELTHLRQSLDGALRDNLGLRAAVAGTHPTVTRSEVALSAGVRYQQIGATMRTLALREPTMAQHVHVLIRRPAQRPSVLLALSANSPFWRGRDSGFASIRTPIFSMFPRVGIPRRFGDYTEYVSAVEPMLRSGRSPTLDSCGGMPACVRGSAPSRSGSWTRSLASPTPLHWPPSSSASSTAMRTAGRERHRTRGACREPVLGRARRHARAAHRRSHVGGAPGMGRADAPARRLPARRRPAWLRRRVERPRGPSLADPRDDAALEPSGLGQRDSAAGRGDLRVAAGGAQLERERAHASARLPCTIRP